MKQSSFKTSELLLQLQSVMFEKPTIFRLGKTRDVGRAVEIIEKIERSGEWTAVLGLVDCVLAPESLIAESAGHAIEVLLEDIQPLCLLELDYRLRRKWSYAPEWLRRWTDLKLFDKNKLNKNLGVLVTGLTSFHGNGYLREAALRRLDACRNGIELSFLLIRLSDWVPEVRAVAEHLVEQRLKPEYYRHFVHNVVLLDRINQRQHSRADFIERIFSDLLQPSNRAFLLDGLLHENCEVRRVCLKIIRTCSSFDFLKAIDRIILDKDTANRRNIIELLSHLPHFDSLLVLERLVKDRAAAIRLEALRILCEENSNERTPRLMKFLLDKSPAVRLYVRWKLADIGLEIDYRKFYREQLHTEINSALIAAAAGLGETGKSEDAQFLVSFIDVPEVNVRKAVIQALAHLDGKNYFEVFVRQLQSDSPGVSAAAKKAMEPLIDTISPEALWSIFSATTLPHVKHNVLRLLERTSKWDRVSYLLLALSRDDEDLRLRKVAVNGLETWYREYCLTWRYTKPTTDQKDRIVDGMKNLNLALSGSLHPMLGHCLNIVCAEVL